MPGKKSGHFRNGVHREAGTAVLDLLGLLCDTHGVPAHRVILGHLHRFPDRRIHRQVAEAGAFLAFDGPPRVHHGTDHHLLDSLAALADAGHTHQILLGADTVTKTARSTADDPGMPFLLTGLRPRIEHELGADIATAIFTENPARAFAAHWKTHDPASSPFLGVGGHREVKAPECQSKPFEVCDDGFGDVCGCLDHFVGQ